eukprot:359869-Chlamydomonas_euryale.AAC.13
MAPRVKRATTGPACAHLPIPFALRRPSVSCVTQRDQTSVPPLSGSFKRPVHVHQHNIRQH